MNMHPGDLRSIEEQRGADSAQKEETSLTDPPHVSEMTKTLIHIEAGGSFLVGIVISRLRWVLLASAFGAVYAIAFWVFVGLISAASMIGRGFHQMGGQIDLDALEGSFNGHVQYPSRTHESPFRMQSWIEPILRDHSDALEWIRSTSVLTTWLMLRTGTKRGHVPDPRPTKSRFPVQMELVEELLEISFDRSCGATHYTPMLAYILGYPEFESWSAKPKHYWQASTTGCLLIKTNGSSVRSEIERAKVRGTCEEDDGKGSLTARKGVSEIGNTPPLVWTDDGHRIGCTPRSMGYECDAAYWMWLLAEIHFTMASVNWPLKSQSGTQAQTPPVDLPWEGILLRPITFHVQREECIYNTSQMNYSTTTSSLRMYLSIALQAAKGSSTICSSGEG